MPAIPSYLGSSSGVPRNGESVVIVRRMDAYKEAVNILVDGQKVLTLNKNEEGRYIVSNGNHVLSAEIPSEQRIKGGPSYNASTKDFKVNSVTSRFDVVLSASPQMVVVNLTEIGSTSLK